MRQPETLLDQLSRISREHGFASRIDCTGCVIVSIPYIHLETRETGLQEYRVTSLRQLRDALGY